MSIPFLNFDLTLDERETNNQYYLGLAHLHFTFSYFFVQFRRLSRTKNAVVSEIDFFLVSVLIGTTKSLIEFATIINF